MRDPRRATCGRCRRPASSARRMTRSSSAAAWVRTGRAPTAPRPSSPVATWAPRGRLRYLGLADREWDGIRGEARAWLIAEPVAGDLRATVLWVDRSDRDAPWVNQSTLGLRPMRTYHLSSRDGGWTWTDRRRFDTSPHPGSSPTGPLLQLVGGRLGQPFEHWKEYDDASPGRPAAHLRISSDGGLTWPEESLVAADGRESRLLLGPAPRRPSRHRTAGGDVLDA